MNKYTKCPSFGEDWNTTKFRSYECGARVILTPSTERLSAEAIWNKYYLKIGSIFISHADENIAVGAMKEYAAQEVKAAQEQFDIERRKIGQLYSEIFEAKDKRIAELENWKREMLIVGTNLDLQTIGHEIGAKIGSDVSPQVLPTIRKYKSRIAELERENDTIRDLHKQAIDKMIEYQQHTEKLMGLLEEAIKNPPLYTSDHPGPRWQSYCREHGLKP